MSPDYTGYVQVRGEGGGQSSDCSLLTALSGAGGTEHSHLLSARQQMFDDSGDQHPHPRPAGPLLNAPPDGAEPAPGGEPGTRQGEAHLAARPQGGGGLHVPADC